MKKLWLFIPTTTIISVDTVIHDVLVKIENAVGEIERKQREVLKLLNEEMYGDD